MVLTKTPVKKHRNIAMTTKKDDGTILTEHRKTSFVKKLRGPDKMNIKQKETKIKTSNIKNTKILKSASVTKKTGDLSKIPVPLSKSSTYKQVTVQKQKTIHKKKNDDMQPAKPEQNIINNSVALDKQDVNFVMAPKDKSNVQLDKFYKNNVSARVKQIKKNDVESQKKLKGQYISSVLADIRKADLDTTLQKYAAGNENDESTMDSKKQKNESTTESKKKKRKSIKKKPPPPKIVQVSPRIVSENNENSSINSLKKDTPSMTTHFLEADSQSSQIPIIKKNNKIIKQKKSPRAKPSADTKSTQLTQHKKKSKTHTLKLNRVQSSDSVPNLPVREIKHNDSFVLSAKKLEKASSMKRSIRYKKSPEQLKLKPKRPMSAHPAAFRSAEPRSDSTKHEQLKSCLKKNWDDNEFSPVQNNKYEMNFGLVPLIVN